MKRLSKQYAKEIYREFTYYATWLPSVDMHLGDVGFIRNNQFERIGTLEELDIPFSIHEDTTKVDLEHKSEGAISISSKVSGAAVIPGSNLAEADAGYHIKFSRDKAILFQAKGVVNPYINDSISVGNEILKRYKNGSWNKDWVVVTEIAKADSSTILVSNSSDSIVDIHAKGNLKLQKLELADLDASLSIAYQRDLGIKIIANQGLTPLFRVKGLRGIFNPTLRSKASSPMDLFAPNDASDQLEFGDIPRSDN